MEVPLRSGTLLIVVLFTLTAFASAGRELIHHKSPHLSSIPKQIKVPSGNKRHIALLGVGLQNYVSNGSTWVFQNATADLYTLSKEKKLVGKHFFLPKPDIYGGQPSWSTFHPKSLVTAKTLESVTIDPNSITWTLFQATTEHGSKKELGAVTYLQRIKTKGGLAPAALSRSGVSVAVPYSTIYIYYVKKH
eukprot:c17754_g1_i2 orf=428-1000(+)